jgi:hypothetical protein
MFKRSMGASCGLVALMALGACSDGPDDIADGTAADSITAGLKASFTCDWSNDSCNPSSAKPAPWDGFCGNTSSGECAGGGTMADQKGIGAFTYSHSSTLKGRSELVKTVRGFKENHRVRITLTARMTDDGGTFLQVQPRCGRWTPHAMVTWTKDKVLMLSSFSGDASTKRQCETTVPPSYFWDDHTYVLEGYMANSNDAYWDLSVDGVVYPTKKCGGDTGHTLTGDNLSSSMCSNEDGVDFKTGAYEGGYTSSSSSGLFAKKYSFSID